MSLHIEKQKSGNNEYIRLVSLKRMKSSNGRLMIGKKTIVSLGALAKHDDGDGVGLVGAVELHLAARRELRK